ncbi:MAG: hypothetical protein JNK56_15280 [Myxococcales bacterium]|nr:hypothetical protein [Myxococcales bacterium]
MTGTAALAGGAFLYGRRASAASPSAPAPDDAAPTPIPAPKIELAPLPSAADVKGDLSRNWGETPFDLRALFLLMEETSRIVGSARIFAVIAYRESRFVTTAHNGDAVGEQGERDASLRAYTNNKANNPPLRYGEQAAAFGSGGLFGLLAPYFLWTGVPEVKTKAPLLGAPPELMFQPRAAAFGATVYLQRILKSYRVDDIPDIKAGWASPSLLTTARGSSDYNDARARFLADVKAVGIDLADATIPPKLDASAWPGVPAVFAGLVGSLPKEVA